MTARIAWVVDMYPGHDEMLYVYPMGEEEAGEVGLQDGMAPFLKEYSDVISVYLWAENAGVAREVAKPLFAAFTAANLEGIPF